MFLLVLSNKPLNAGCLCLYVEGERYVFVWKVEKPTWKCPRVQRWKREVTCFTQTLDVPRSVDRRSR